MPNSVQHITNLLNLSYSVQQKPGRNWAVVFRWPPGTNSQKWVTSNSKDKADAEARAPEIIARWFHKNGINPPTKSAEGIHGAIERFMATKYRYKAENTVTEARGALERVAELISVGWESAGTADFEAIVPVMMQGIKPKTWSNKLAVIRRFWRWAVSEGLAAGDVTKTTEYPPKSSFGRREDLWEPAYFEAITAAASPDDADVLQLMRWTGLDSSDIATLTKAHILPDSKGTLQIVKRRQKAKSDLETVRQPISKKILPIIKRRMAKASGPEYRLFPAKYRDPHVFTVCLWDRVSAVMARLSLPAIHLKCLRHTFATYHIERGVPEDVLAHWLGHTPGSTTLRRFYLHRKSTSSWMD